MFRAGHGVFLVLTLMAANCSRVLVADDPPEIGGGDDEAAGGAEAIRVRGSGGSSPDESPATPLVDSGTLSVAVSISAGNYDPAKIGQADAARVSLTVTVAERGTWAPVPDAEVRGGPPGGLVPLPYDVYSCCSYDGEIIGYQPVWELSIVRGSDRLEGLLVEGPMYPSAAVSIDATSGFVAWSPASQLGVTARVCATTTNVPPPYALFSQLCVDTVDSGGLLLDAEERAEMFPFTGTYWVVVERFLNQPTVSGDERSVVVFAGMDLSL